MRVGHGYDAHSLVAGRPLVLGGVTIPHNKGLAGHSDGDGVIHALCDALLGAAGLGDIGHYFPDNDPAFLNIDSRVLLRQIVAVLSDKQLAMINADLTILAQTPKMAPYMAEMKTNLACDLACDPALINIKASTTEKMGFIGREEGIAVYAVALINTV